MSKYNENTTDEEWMNAKLNVRNFSSSICRTNSYVNLKPQGAVLQLEELRVDIDEWGTCDDIEDPLFKSWELPPTGTLELDLFCRNVRQVGVETHSYDLSVDREEIESIRSRVFHSTRQYLFNIRLDGILIPHLDPDV